MVALAVIVAALFVVGLCSRGRVEAGQPVVLVYLGLAVFSGVLAALLSRNLMGVHGVGVVTVGVLWAMLIVAMPAGNLVRDRLAARSHR